jgi:3-oxoacyl-[acyl-carrier protein] reductase
MANPTSTVLYPDLADKTAVITGGSRGIGAATAYALASNGVKVVVVGRDRAALESVVVTIEHAGQHARGFTADCTSASELQQLRDQVHDQLGPADLLVAFAGGDGAPVDSTSETAEHWQHVVDLNLTATFLTISTFLPDLKARSGAIVTMASSAARQASQSSAAYAAAKGGVVALSRHLANELARDRVRVNCIAPATVENDRMRTYMSDDQRRQMGASFPLGRIGQPEDVASAVLFLASQASSWVTGITVDIAGGKVMP